MSNWKLELWAALGRRPLCETCGELYGTATITDPASTRPACTYCAEWVAAGSPEDYDLDPYWAALDALPWLLRHRPSVRQLNCSTTTYREVAHDPQARADAYDKLRAEYTVASWPVRYAYNAGQNIDYWWHELRCHAGDIADWVRIIVIRSNCGRCSEKAITTARLRADRRQRTPLCDDCHSKVGAGLELPTGGAR